MNKIIDCVIVNWNSGRQLYDCINSIYAFGTGFVNRVIVVDNGSTDHSLEHLSEDSEPLIIIRTGENLGFAKACNLGVKHSTSPYLLFLNPDARLMQGVLNKCLEFMDSEAATNIGILGVQLIDEHGFTQRHCARFPSWRTYLGKALGLTPVFPQVFPSHFMQEFDHLSSRKVDQVIGAFFFVRKELFDNLGGFDERYFVYFEEVDFSLRAKQAGWETYYLANAVAFHKGGGTSNQVKATRLFYSLRSRVLYAFKHFSRAQAWVVLGVSLIIEPVSRFVRAALRGSGIEIHDTVRGYTMLWADLSNIIKSAISRS